MTRTHSLPTLPTFLLLAAIVAIGVFGLTRWLVDADAETLPPLDVAADTAAAAPGALNAAKLFTGRVDTVVAINASMGGTEPITGTGVVVDAAQGTIITASHVIKDYERQETATSITVKFKRGDEVRATLEAIDQNNDLAILSIDPRQVSGLVAAPIGDSNAVQVGAPVAAIGGPFGYDFSLSQGIVSSAHRPVESRINGNWDIPDMLQVDGMGINRGSSGGPLFNARGEVIGIMQQIPTATNESAGIAFAVSSSIVSRAWKMWKDTGRQNITYAYPGWEAEDVTPQLAQAGKLGTTVGAILQSSQGAAQQAGLRSGTKQVTGVGGAVLLGDVVVELAGQQVRSRADLARVSGLLVPGQAAKVTFLRDGERRTATITPTEAQLF